MIITALFVDGIFNSSDLSDSKKLIVDGVLANSSNFTDSRKAYLHLRRQSQIL